MLETQLRFNQPSPRAAKVIAIEQRRLELDYRVNVLFESLAGMVRFAKSLKPGARYVPKNPTTEEPLVNEFMIILYKAQFEMLKATARGEGFFEQHPRALEEIEASIRKLEGYFLPEESSSVYNL